MLNQTRPPYSGGTRVGWLLKRARRLADDGLFIDAIRTLWQAYRLEPERCRQALRNTYAQYGLELIKARRSKQAIEELQLLETEGLASGDVHAVLSRALLRTGERRAAVGEAEKAIDYQPRNPHYHVAAAEAASASAAHDFELATARIERRWDKYCGIMRREMTPAYYRAWDSALDHTEDAAARMNLAFELCGRPTDQTVLQRLQAIITTFQDIPHHGGYPSKTLTRHLSPRLVSALRFAPAPLPRGQTPSRS